MRMFAALIAAFSLLSLAACSSNNVNEDKVPDLAPESLYQMAESAMASGDYKQARRYLEAIDSRYPFCSLTDQVQLDLIYLYYKTRESELTTAQINRFLRLNPTSQYNDYVTYMKGLNQIQMRGNIIQEYLGLNRSEKDPSQYLEAMHTFNDLINNYPNSAYAADARQRMVFIKNQLAEREFKIASYYKERGAWLSSIRHCQNILYSYRNTSYLRPALTLMADNFERLGLKQPADNARAVLASTFGGAAD
ncbi:MAG: outer membrane protein assembly factor BamD [Succinivibrionaceae bacterium]|nr:outer membrane protein assembly factor BamD [Succinivibrionaceae bacterium]